MNHRYSSAYKVKSNRYNLLFFAGLLYLTLGWQIQSGYTQPNGFSCPDLNFEFFPGNSTSYIYMSVPDCTIHEPGDQISVTFYNCMDSDDSGDVIVFDFQECTNDPEIYSVFAADGSFPECYEIVADFPDGSVGFYNACDGNPPNEIIYCNEECFDPCTSLNVLDAWGGLIDASYLPSFGPGQDDVNVQLHGRDAEPIDFGCVELCRMSTRTFYAMNCESPMILQDVTIYDYINDFGLPDDITIFQDPLLTGMIMCPADVTVDLGQWCCDSNGSVYLAEDCFECSTTNGDQCIPDPYYFCSNTMPMLKPTTASIQSQTMSRIEALITEDCHITINDMYITGVFLPGTSANNEVGDHAFELITNESFPMNVSLGDYIEFDVKFKPEEDNTYYAAIVICFENSCPCYDVEDFQALPGGPQNQGNGNCEQYIYIDIMGEGDVCTDEDFLSDCQNICPDEIILVSAIEPPDYYPEDVTVCDHDPLVNVVYGYATEEAKGGAPSNEECGFLCYNLLSGQLLVAVDDDNDWEVLFPGETTDADCNDNYTPISHPGFPFLFFDIEDQIMYLIKEDSYQTIDLLLELDNDTNCGHFEPGEMFTLLVPDDIPDLPEAGNANGNGSYSTSMYEYVACDGEYLYAKLSSGDLPDVTVDYFIAEFPNLSLYAHYYDDEEGCWESEGCNLVRTELYVVDEDLGPLCNQHDPDLLVQNGEPGTSNYSGLLECSSQAVDMGCTELGSPLSRELSLLNCKSTSGGRLPEANLSEQPNGPHSQEFEFTCDDLFMPTNNTTADFEGIHHNFGANCSIEIKEIFFIGQEDCGFQPIPGSVATQGLPVNGTETDFEVLSPSLPLTLNHGENLTIEVGFDPEETGKQCAYAVICFENNCPSCVDHIDLPDAGALTEHEFPCNSSKIFVFDIMACAYEFSVTDILSPEFMDPCSCDDPDNIVNESNGTIEFFHNVLQIDWPNDGTWTLESISPPGALYDMNGDPLDTELPLDGTYDLISEMWVWEVWQVPGEEVFVNFSHTSGSNIEMAPVTICEDICTPIPTLSQWGIILLGLLMMIFGTVAVKQRVTRQAGV